MSNVRLFVPGNLDAAMIKGAAFLFALTFSLLAFGQQGGKEAPCRNGGALVMGSWHRLDLCLRHRKLGEREVLEAKQAISAAYPGIQRDVIAGSDLSVHMRQVASALPDDFGAGQNAEVLTSICANSMAAMQRFIEPNWQRELACWK